MIYDVTHVTVFDYDERVSVSHHIARMTPRTSARQTLVDHAWAFDPEPAVRREHHDVFDNPVTFFAVQGPHERLTVTARAVVELAASPPRPPASPPWERVRDGLSDAPVEVLDFVYDSPLVTAAPAYAAYAARSFPPGRPIVDGVVDLTSRLHHDFRFEAGVTTVATPVADVFRHRAGVCQDFAHVQLACLRSLGLAARYVSGYLETSPPPDEPRLVGADASHAWVAVYVPGFGWLDADPTNDKVPADRHVTLAWGRDYSDVSPIRGVILGGGEQRARVAVDLVRRG
jgi:transglutaminase-like putative cysteine protease